MDIPCPGQCIGLVICMNTWYYGSSMAMPIVKYICVDAFEHTSYLIILKVCDAQLDSILVALLWQVCMPISYSIYILFTRMIWKCRV